MLDITRDEAERIAFSWLSEQETKIDLYGGYPGELFVCRDMLVWFINCNGEKYDGPYVKICTKEDALKDESWRVEEEEGETDWRNHEAFFGESVQAIADYLMSAEGGPDEYSAGDPYKENSPASIAWRKHIKNA